MTACPSRALAAHPVALAVSLALLPLASGAQTPEPTPNSRSVDAPAVTDAQRMAPHDHRAAVVRRAADAPDTQGAASPGNGAETDTTLGTISVRAYRTVTHTQSATKTDTPVAQTPQAVSVIGRDELDARGVRNLNEAMRYVSGVSLESTGIDNRVDDFRIRGYDTGSWSNNVTLDGMRAPQGTQFNRTAIDTWALERVDVLKGPSSVLYGQMAPGGLVNQVSKTPEPGLPTLLRLGVNGWGQLEGAIDTGGGTVDNRHLFRLNALLRKGRTQIRETREERAMVAPSYTLKLAERTRLTLLGLYQRDHGGATYQFLPQAGTLDPTPFGRIDNRAFLGVPSWNTYNRTVWTAGWLFEHALNDDWTLSQSARYLHVDSLYRTAVTLGPLNADGRTQNRRAIESSGTSKGVTVDTRVQGKLRTGDIRHTVLLGLDWQKADLDGDRIAMNNPAPIDIFTRVQAAYTPVRMRSQLFDETHEQTGLYVQEQMEAGPWRVALGARHDWTQDDLGVAQHVHANNRTSPWQNSQIKDKALTGHAGVLYDTGTGLLPYASYATSFLPAPEPATMSFTGTPFDPIRGRQVEVGTKWQPAGFDGLVTVSAFQLEQSNIVTRDPDPTHNTCGAGAVQCRVQGGKSRVRGLELEGRLTPMPGFSVIGAVSRMRSKVLEGEAAIVGNQLAQVPRWTAALWADHTWQTGSLGGLSLAAGMRYIGKSFGNEQNTIAVPGHVLMDAAVRYDLGELAGVPTQFALNASNLADKTFISTCTSAASCHFGTGRTVWANLSFRW